MKIGSAFRTCFSAHEIAHEWTIRWRRELFFPEIVQDILMGCKEAFVRQL